MSFTLSNSIAYYYFCTLDGPSLSRLCSSIDKQRIVDAECEELRLSKRILVCDESATDIPTDVTEFFHGRIFRCNPYVLDAKGKSHFGMSHLRNLAIGMARKSEEDWLYFCDADTIIVEPSTPLDQAKYCVPNVYWQKERAESINTSLENIARDGVAAYSNGNSWFMIHRDLFSRFDFNERMYGYGYEDIEFYARIGANGYTLQPVSGLVIHNFHEHSERNIKDEVLSRNKAIFEAGTLVWTWNPKADWRNSIVYRTDDDQFIIYYSDICAAVNLQKKWVQQASLKEDKLCIRGADETLNETFYVRGDRLSSQPTFRPIGRNGSPMLLYDTVFDMGFHKGEDTDYYLKKGFKVVAFEASPQLVEDGRVRFAEQLLDGRLIIMSGAVAPRDQGESITFFQSAISVWGTIDAERDDLNHSLGASSSRITVPRIDVQEVFEEIGIPYFLKVDIEGMDQHVLDCLKAANGLLRPVYLSMESDKTDFGRLKAELDRLVSLGYRRFRAVQQAGLNGSRVQGTTIGGQNFEHVFAFDTSGPFGEDLAQPWMSYDQVLHRYRQIFILYDTFGDTSQIRRGGQSQIIKDLEFALNSHLPGWYDTHATF